MTDDGSDAQTIGSQPGVTSTLTEAEINWLPHTEVDRLTRWHFGATVVGSIGAAFLSAGICQWFDTDGGPLSTATKVLFWGGLGILAVAFIGFWVFTHRLKKQRGRGRPIEDIQFADSTSGSTT